MKEETKIRVANKLVKNEFIFKDPINDGVVDLPRLPMVFVVNEEVCLTYYAAARVAYGTKNPKIEVFTIDEAVDVLREIGEMDVSVEELTIRWSADVVGSLFMGRFLFENRTVDADMFLPNVVCGLQENNRHWKLYNKFIMWKVTECRRLSAMPPVFRV